MAGINHLPWIAAGVGLTLVCEALAWLYWRHWGAGSIQDYICEEDEPDGEYRVLLKKKTPVQRIAVVEHNGHTLIFGNGYMMFGTIPGEDSFAEALIHVPMALARKRDRVLILGGGGGITTREVLKYPEVREITVVDADETMVHFGKNLDALVRFNGGSLLNPKVRTVVKDARAFVESNPGNWDVIVVDLPEPSRASPGLKRLFSREFYMLLADRLEPGGVIAVACANPSWMSEYFWSIHATLKASDLHVLPYRYDAFVEDEEDWGFCVAAPRPISPGDVRISVPTQFLTSERMKELFHIPYGIRLRKCEAEVQTDSNDVLAEMTEDD